MKLLIVLLAVIVAALADVSHLDSTTTEQPAQDSQDLSPAASTYNAVNREYLPPQARASDPVPAHTFGADGYRYKEPENKFYF